MYSLQLSMLVCWNPMSASGRNYCHSVNVSQDISMTGINVRQMYREWHDTVCDGERNNVCILREHI